MYTQEEFCNYAYKEGVKLRKRNDWFIREFGSPSEGVWDDYYSSNFLKNVEQMAHLKAGFNRQPQPDFQNKDKIR